MNRRELLTGLATMGGVGVAYGVGKAFGVRAGTAEVAKTPQSPTVVPAVSISGEPLAVPGASTGSTPGAAGAETPKPTATGVSTTRVERTATPEARITATPTSEGRKCISLSEGLAEQLLEAPANWPYELIKELDKLPEKVDKPVGGFTVKTDTGQIAVFWTGRYNQEDLTDGGKTAVLTVDGQTGVFALKPKQELTIMSPSGLVCVADVPEEQIAKLDREDAERCVPRGLIVDTINNNKGKGQLYVALDELANQYSDARLRSDEKTSVVGEGSPLTRIVWIRQDSLKGGGAMPLDIYEGKELYLLVENGQAQASWPHSGLISCKDINPQRDFPWWGK